MYQVDHLTIIENDLIPGLNGEGGFHTEVVEAVFEPTTVAVASCAFVYPVHELALVAVPGLARNATEFPLA